MGLLDGRVALIFGVANNHSIAWGIAQALQAQGCELAFSYAGEALERRVRPLAASVGSGFVEPCDVARDEDIAGLFARFAGAYGRLDVLVHSVAFAPREALTGLYADTTREAFHTALDVSAYSFVALAREAARLMQPGGSLLTMTYYGAEKVMPHYNVMGVAKAALEASVRYLAADFGPRGVRVNAISAGPIKTLAAAGVAGFRDMLHYAEERAPLRRNMTLEDIGRAAVFLASDLSAGMTGEVLYVDGGYNILGMSEPLEKLEALSRQRAGRA
jgi:enoyl-[acyl-carrier protein] reductase I